MEKNTIVNKSIKTVAVVIFVMLIFVSVGFAFGRYGKPLQVVNFIFFLLVVEVILVYIRDRKEL